MPAETRIQGVSQDSFEKLVQKHLDGDCSVCWKIRKDFLEVRTFLFGRFCHILAPGSIHFQLHFSFILNIHPELSTIGHHDSTSSPAHLQFSTKSGGHTPGSSFYARTTNKS